MPPVLIYFQTLFDTGEMGAQSVEKCDVVIGGLSELRDKIDKSICESNEPADPPSIAKPEGDNMILSPVATHGKGRPPFKIKVSRSSDEGEGGIY